MRRDWVQVAFTAAAIVGGLVFLALVAVGCERQADCEKRGGVYVRASGRVSGFVCLEAREIKL